MPLRTVGLALSTLILSATVAAQDGPVAASPEESLLLFLSKRTPAAADLPVERYEEAVRRLESMPGYVLSRAERLDPAAKAARRPPDASGWIPDGPAHAMGQARILLADPADGDGVIGRPLNQPVLKVETLDGSSGQFQQQRHCRNGDQNDKMGVSPD